VSVRLPVAGIRVVLLDIEGTTTPIAFVHDVLFPYARARMRSYLDSAASDAELQQTLSDLGDERIRDVDQHQLPAASFRLPASDFQFPASGPPREAGSWQLEAVVAYIHWLMDRDRKSGPLKVLQGKIWERGYASGELKGEVYPDVPDALARWTDAGVGVGIFSSGSVLAQRLLFSHSTAGDLTPFLRWYFDTAVGPKVDSESYRRIVDALGISSSQVLFVSDVAKELAAAREAEIQTVLCVRPPADPPPSSPYPVVRTLAEIEV
jgi:enolase-phosphatase E1